MTKQNKSKMRTKVLYIIPVAAIALCAIALPKFINNHANNNNMVYDKVEVMPEYPGGTEAMIKFMGDNMKYPKSAEDRGAKGKAMVSFVVEKDGKVGEVKTAKFIADGDISAEDKNSLIAEAERVVASMPNWTPGKQGGENVRVSFIMPIKFQLQ